MSTTAHHHALSKAICFLGGTQFMGLSSLMIWQKVSQGWVPPAVCAGACECRSANIHTCTQVPPAVDAGTCRCKGANVRMCKRAAPAVDVGTCKRKGANVNVRTQVAPAVDEGIVKELEAMGFSHNKAVRAVYHSGGGGSESAVNWLMEHEQDPDIDQPLLVTKVGVLKDAISHMQ
eukprot:103241-Pelagomonas_calceolata.AAC.1